MVASLEDVLLLRSPLAWRERELSVEEDHLCTPASVAELLIGTREGKARLAAKGRLHQIRPVEAGEVFLGKFSLVALGVHDG